MRVELRVRAGPPAERVLRAHRAPPAADLHRSGVEVVRERVQVPARRLAEHRRRAASRPSVATSPTVSMPRARSLFDVIGPTPQSRSIGKRMQEVQLAFGFDDEQPVGLGDTARDLGEELRAGDADGDRQADPRDHVLAQADRDLARVCPRPGPSPPTSRNASSIDSAFDQRCRVVEHLEHGPARFGVRVGMRGGDDQAGAQPARLPSVHRGAHAEGLGLVARGEHDTAADDRRACRAGAGRRAARPTRRSCRGRRAGSRRDRPGHEHMFA